MASQLGEDFYRTVLESLRDAVYFVDRERRITFWNASAERLTGYSATEVVGRFCHDNLLCHCDYAGRMLCHDGCPLQQTLKDGQPRQAEVFLRHRLGHRVPVEVRIGALGGSEEITGAVEVFNDISSLHEARRRSDELLAVANTDPLTGLANRKAVEEVLNEWIGDKGPKSVFGVMMIDVDHFKKINDTYGHEAGDAVLKMISRTLRSALRSCDVVGRWGGEEFLALVVTDSETLLREIAERCRVMVETSLLTGEQTIGVTVSIGATLVGEGDSRGSAVERADSLLYQSKAEGRNRVSVGRGVVEPYIKVDGSTLRWNAPISVQPERQSTIPVAVEGAVETLR